MTQLVVIRGAQNLLQRGQGLFRVVALGGEFNGHAIFQPHRQQAQQTFGVDAVVLPGDSDVAGKLIGLFDEECGGIIQVLIGNMYNYSFSQQISHPRVQLLKISIPHFGEKAIFY